MAEMSQRKKKRYTK